MNKEQKKQVEKLSSILEIATQKEILNKDEIKEIDTHLDVILSSIDNNKKFFKRLL